MGLLQKLLDLVYPPRCVYCGGLLDHASPDPCHRCQKHLPWTEGETCLQKGKYFTDCLSPGWYEGELRASLLRYKFAGHPEYAQAYAQVLAQEIRHRWTGQCDLISWIPVSQETLRRRGYDQARLLAEETAAILGLTAVPTLRKIAVNAKQSTLEDRESRRQNVQGVYAALDPEELPGQRILLIDDIITTGFTLEEGAKTLLAAGANQVLAATFCRVRPLPNTQRSQIFREQG